MVTTIQGQELGRSRPVRISALKNDQIAAASQTLKVFPAVFIYCNNKRAFLRIPGTSAR